ncbi:hypothetical protein PANT_22d00093 [Moesziomyces antarcticus T-34]|uniref:N-acetyltransferase domain-containing protein n=1 Tax=Pseudozyma antarctica (strain T-34) TaxID=1151754 RepID=M9MFY0_PSEA3|nr:hypothetical protein PANT_22d00093 [Moesziomyces antarcticus T-34]
MASAEPTSSTPSTSSISLDAAVPTPSGDHATPSTTSARADSIVLEPYDGEHQMADIIDLIENELSEPYIVHTYRYFVNQWPQLCFLAYAPPDSAAGARLAVGVVVCKLDRHLKGARLMRGYIAMISVRNTWRGQGMAKRLVRHAVQHMVDSGAQEVVLETEADNVAALALYEGLGFIREKRLHRFYLNGKGKDSFRLVLPVPPRMQKPVPPHIDVPPPTGLVQPPYPGTSHARQQPPSQPPTPVTSTTQLTQDLII